MTKLGNTITAAACVSTATLLLTNTFVPTFAFAAPTGTYSAARTQFNNGNLQGTKKSLESILLPRPNVTGKELEESRKLYGVCLFLLNKKREAESVFLELLTTNSNAKIRKQDILDPQIGTLFENVRAKVQKPGQTNKPTITAAKKLPTAGANESILLLTCDTKNASVFCDGLYVGSCNSPITLEPGRHEVTVSAEGHEDAVKQFELKAGQSQGFEVHLKKYSEPKDQVPMPERDTYGRSTSGFQPEQNPAQLPLPVPAAPPQQDNTIIQLKPLQDDAAPEVFIQPQAYSSRETTRNVVPRRSYLVALLPFGAGQFQNGESLKGGISLMAQLTGLGIYAYSRFRVDEFQAKVDHDPSAYNDNEVSKYKSNMNLLGKVGLASSGIVYFISAIDALVNIRKPAIVNIENSSTTRLAILPTGELGITFTKNL